MEGMKGSKTATRLKSNAHEVPGGAQPECAFIEQHISNAFQQEACKRKSRNFRASRAHIENRAGTAITFIPLTSR